jgi:hypothetical protein
MAAEAPSEPYEVEIGADPVAPVVSHAFNKKPVHAPHAAVNESPVVVLVGAPMVPGERMHVVRMRVARETLMSMGLRAIDGGETEAVDVEMLVGEDGVARGLRAAM